MNTYDEQFFADKPYCRCLEENSKLNLQYDTNYATDNICLAILQEDGLKSKNANEQLIKLMDRYCYKITKLLWNVITKDNVQYIVMYGSTGIRYVNDFIFNYILHYLPDSFKSVSNGWGLITFKTKFKKCFVIKLETIIFNHNDLSEIQKKYEQVLTTYKIKK